MEAPRNVKIELPYDLVIPLLDVNPNSSVQFRSLTRVQLFVTPWTAARQASLPITNSRSLLKLLQIKKKNAPQCS